MSTYDITEKSLTQIRESINESAKAFPPKGKSGWIRSGCSEIGQQVLPLERELFSQEKQASRERRDVRPLESLVGRVGISQVPLRILYLSGVMG